MVVAKLHTHEFAYGPTGDVAATGPGPQPARPDPDHRRLVVGVGGGGGGRAPAARARHRHRRERAHPRRAVRGGRAEARVRRACPPRARSRSSESLRPRRACSPPTSHSASVAWDVLDRPDGTGGGIQEPGVTGVRVGVPVDATGGPRTRRSTRSSRPPSNGCGARGAEVVEVRTPMIDELAATYPRDRRGGGVGDARRGGSRSARRTTSRSPENGWRPNADLPARGVRRRRCAPGGGSSRRCRAALDVDVLVLPDHAAAGHADRRGDEVVDGRRAGAPVDAGADAAVQPRRAGPRLGAGRGGRRRPAGRACRWSACAWRSAACCGWRRRWSAWVERAG